MSQIPSDIKETKKNPWTWVDHQLDKLMKANSKLREENKKLQDKYDRLYKLHIEGTPTDGYEV